MNTPSLSFGTAWTVGPLDSSAATPIGEGLASFLLGLPTGGTGQIDASYANKFSYSGLYLQDNWKLTRKLSVNLGIRYEYEWPLEESHNRSVREFDFTTANPIEAAAEANYAKSPIPQVPISQFHVSGGLIFAGVGGQPSESGPATRIISRLAWGLPTRCPTPRCSEAATGFSTTWLTRG